MTRHQSTDKKSGRAAREAQLAAKLRENLKRRKAQARARNNSSGSDRASQAGSDENGQS